MKYDIYIYIKYISIYLYIYIYECNTMQGIYILPLNTVVFLRNQITVENNI